MIRRSIVVAVAGAIAFAGIAVVSAVGDSDSDAAAPTTTVDRLVTTTARLSGPDSTAEAPDDPVPGPERGPSGSRFADIVVRRLDARGVRAADACDVTNVGVQRVFADYGAVFVAADVTPPTRCIFADEGSTAAFQATLDQASSTVGGVAITLQRPALEAFEAAVAEAQSRGVRISPRGTLGSARTFTTAQELWRSRVDPGLDRYVSTGQVAPERAQEIRAMGNLEQVAAILELEGQGLRFGRHQAGSIMSSVAPPGASQHHALLAQDVAEFGSAAVHEILARHGFFQTVVDDEPHFTYLGVSEADLPSLGLRLVEVEVHRYWVPDV